ncbi:SPOSA6832_01915, partial [Sporobolomyces salmonicolor]
MPVLTDSEQISALAAPLQLPCGLELQNRLVKAAMEEMLGTGNGLPSELDCELYRTWAEGGYGMILSGNVQVSPEHLGTPLDIVVPSSSSSSRGAALAAFSSWASSLTPSPSSIPPKCKRPVSIMQLNHAGRQSVRFFCGRSPFKPSLAPSAVPMTSGSGPLGRLIGRLIWGTPKEMSEDHIAEVVDSFVRGAKLAKESGWDGVQLHASHGYLLAQFMSPKVHLEVSLLCGAPR